MEQKNYYATDKKQLLILWNKEKTGATISNAFKTPNDRVIRIKSDNLEQGKEKIYKPRGKKDTFNREKSQYSYHFDQKWLNNVRETYLESDIDNLFLYGHSSWRVFVEKEKGDIRGASAFKKFIPAEELAKLVCAILPDGKPCNIWLITCYGGGDDVAYSDEKDGEKIEITSFAQDLMIHCKLGASTIYSYARPVTSKTLLVCRKIAHCKAPADLALSLNMEDPQNGRKYIDNLSQEASLRQHPLRTTKDVIIS